MNQHSKVKYYGKITHKNLRKYKIEKVFEFMSWMLQESSQFNNKGSIYLTVEIKEPK